MKKIFRIWMLFVVFCNLLIFGKMLLLIGKRCVFIFYLKIWSVLVLVKMILFKFVVISVGSSWCSLRLSGCVYWCFLVFCWCVGCLVVLVWNCVWWCKVGCVFWSVLRWCKVMFFVSVLSWVSWIGLLLVGVVWFDKL